MGVEKLSDIIKEITQNRPDLLDSEDVDFPISSFKDLNRLFQKRDLVVLASRSSIGKTSVLLDFLVRHVVKTQQPILFIALRNQMEYIARKIELLLQEKGALGLSDLIYINNPTKLNKESLQALITKSIVNDRVRAVFIDDFHELAYSSNVSNIYDGPFNDEDLGFPLLHFLKVSALINWVPIYITENIETPSDNPRTSFAPNVNELRNPNIGIIADYVISLNRPEYYDFTENHLGDSVGDMMQVRLIKTKYGKSGSIFEIQFPDQLI